MNFVKFTVFNIINQQKLKIIFFLLKILKGQINQNDENEISKMEKTAQELALVLDYVPQLFYVNESQFSEYGLKPRNIKIANSKTFNLT